MARVRCTAIALLLTAAGAPDGSAQMIRGRVVAAGSDAPIPYATVMIFQDTALLRVADAGPDGRFELTLPDSGRYALVARSQGFSAVGPIDFEAPAGRMLEVTVRMAQDVVVLEPLTVRVRAMPRNSLEAARLRSSDNRHFGIGFHLGRDEIAASTRRTSTVHLIEAISPAIRTFGFGLDARLGTTRRGRACAFALFVDGVQVLGGTVEPLPMPDEIDTVEVYTGAIARGGYQDRAGCGMVLVWTRHDVERSRYRRTLLGTAVLGGVAAVVTLFLLAN